MMDEAIGGMPSITPPVLVAVVVSPQSRRQERAGSSRKWRNSDLLEFLQRQAELEEEREKEALGIYISQANIVEDIAGYNHLWGNVGCTSRAEKKMLLHLDFISPKARSIMERAFE
ncbi:hypothetical protein SKAU_G00060260 [Synaphobranchus kaupii]|uniref:Uncharacterized protein n=1 Tax=Synaphobranchus kaupii TaxID=118154 RepID=A0A9Q1G583_SYNKA|nr:hypothetical protein SKAU_G00060260 [Synaphobranchus kaupii]